MLLLIMPACPKGGRELGRSWVFVFLLSYNQAAATLVGRRLKRVNVADTEPVGIVSHWLCRGANYSLPDVRREAGWANYDPLRG